MQKFIFNEKELLDYVCSCADTILNSDIKVLFLNGPLGAGKTFFVKSLCAALSYKCTANSPSFGFYRVYNHVSQKQIWHYDLYRLDQDCRHWKGLQNIDIEEALSEGNFVIIEWGSPQLQQEFTDMRFEIKIINIDYCEAFDKRVLTIS